MNKVKAVAGRFTESPEAKPGLYTSEFWLVLLGNILINVGAIDVGGATYRGLFAIISVVGYTLARGMAKQGQTYYPPNDPSLDADEGASDEFDASELQPGDTGSTSVTNVYNTGASADVASAAAQDVMYAEPEGDVTKFGEGGNR